MRVREVPNGNIEVQMGDTPDSSSKEIKLEAFLKMIEKLDEFNDLDKWLPKTEFIIEYKK